jgi:hypothetical protein
MDDLSEGRPVDLMRTVVGKIPDTSQGTLPEAKTRVNFSYTYIF